MDTYTSNIKPPTTAATTPTPLAISNPTFAAVFGVTPPTVIFTSDPRQLSAPCLNIHEIMHPTNPPSAVFHRKSLWTVVACVTGGFFLLLGLQGWLSGHGLSVLYLVGTGLAVLTVLFEVQTVTFHDTYLSINYPLRKRRIEYKKIDFVNFEERRRAGSSHTNYEPTYHKVICLTLANGRKVSVAGFKDGDEPLYGEIKRHVNYPT